MQDINANASAYDGWTPLHWAAHTGQIEVVTLLFKSPLFNAYVTTTSDGSMPLHIAAMKVRAEIVKLPLET